jgi:hypothetical protein
MQRNVGNTDAMIRITGGLLGLAYGIGKMSRRPHNAPWLLMGLSAMKVAEGITRFCPTLAAMGLSTDKENGTENIMDKIKGKGMQAMMNQVTRSMDIADITGTDTPATTTASTAASTEQAAKPANTTLTAEDKQLEEAVREFVAEKSHSEAYTSDEHRYPTYS